MTSDGADAMLLPSVDIQVTDDDKRDARRRSCTDDPVARACRARLGSIVHQVAVDGRVILRHGPGRFVDAVSPDIAIIAAFIRAWDDGGDPEGIVFTLPIPPDDGDGRRRRRPEKFERSRIASDTLTG